MKKKSKLSNSSSTENTKSNDLSSTSSSLTQQGYTKKNGCGCVKKKG